MGHGRALFDEHSVPNTVYPSTITKRITAQNVPRTRGEESATRPCAVQDSELVDRQASPPSVVPAGATLPPAQPIPRWGVGGLEAQVLGFEPSSSGRIAGLDVLESRKCGSISVLYTASSIP